MSVFRRVLVDVSYTRTQTGNVGITRTVRRLFDSLHPVLRAQGVEIAAVAYHSSGFRLAQTASTAAGASGETAGGWTAALWRLLHRGLVRRMVSAALPPALLERAWRSHAVWTFDRLSAAEPHVAFRPGDLLLLGDESWNYRVWTAAEQAASQGAAVVLVCYDLIPIRHPQFCAPLFTAVFQDWLLRTLACSQAVLCISKATQDDLLLFCDEMRVAVPSTAHFRLGGDLPAGGGVIREELTRFAGHAEPLFLTVGTIEPRKNLGLLLHAFERLWQEGSAARLLVAGRPHPECADLVAALRGHAEQGKKLLTLFDATDAELGLAYGRCRAIVLPSLAEGFGLPLVEARVRGCPVIASDLPALAELADGGVFLFPAGDQAALLARLRDHIARDHREQTWPMPAFTWNDSARQLLGVAGTLLGNQWKT